MYPDFKELLSVLNEHRVKYLVVGAYAVSIHAQPRATKDIDILVRPDPENAKAVFTALAKFGAPLEGYTRADFAEAGPFFRMGHAPLGIDILTEIPGAEARVNRSLHLRWTCSANACCTSDTLL